MNSARLICFVKIIILACVMQALFGCSYLNFAAYKAHWGITFKGIPSMTALNNLAPEKSLIVSGRIIKPRKNKEPLLLIAVSNQYQQNEMVASIQIQKSTDIYMAFLPKGDYELLILADLDNSGDFETDEVVGRTLVHVNPDQSISGAVLKGPTITLDLNHPGQAAFHVRETVQPSSYVYSSLDDEFFDPQYGTMGLYYPTEFIYHNQGFIFSLEEYDPSKTMVLFVHGVAGTPRDWKFYAEKMDRSQYQPFFFYYPSGLQLDRLGAVLAQIIQYIGNSSTIHSPKIILVAHSMGGLVALSAINRLSENGIPSYLKMYCSFSTPYGGSDSAQYWTTKMPAKVPAWLDIGAKSNFIQTLGNRPIPDKLPFYLFFTYKTPSTSRQPENSDGAVSIRSQLNPLIQASATRVIGFNETHVGVLNSEAARELFFQLLHTVIEP
ncbi:MAG: hypothetical protein WC539_04440 [Nitrospirota bacterium]